VGLSRFLDFSHPNRLELEILPLRSDAPVYIEASRERGLPATGQVDTLERIELVPEYQLEIGSH
jgi:hypothetical protein